MLSSNAFATEAPFLSDLFADDEDNVPVAPEVIRCNLAIWKEIAEITLIEEEHRLIVIDSGLRSIRVIVNVHRLWRQPRAGLQISRLMVQGVDDNFYPFAASMCFSYSHRVLITSPCFFLTEVSQDFCVLTLIKKISPDGTGRPICCHQFLQDSLIVTCVPDPFNNGDGSVVFLTVDEDTKVDRFLVLEY